MKEVFCILLYCLLFSCESDGFYSNGIDYSGSKKPKILEKYPQEIDSVINDFINGKFQNKVNYKKTVYYGVICEEGDNGRTISYYDTNMYHVNLEVYKKERIMYRFDFSKFKQKIKYLGFEEVE